MKSRAAIWRRLVAIAVEVVLLGLAGCSGQRVKVGGLSLTLGSTLPKACAKPDAFQPGSACATALLANAQEDVVPSDDTSTQVFLDNACADDSAWQPGSTCHVLTDILKRAAPVHAEAPP